LTYTDDRDQFYMDNPIYEPATIRLLEFNDRSPN
jgi:hypothetical protein